MNDPFTPGSTYAGYSIQDLIGKGSSSVVYRVVRGGELRALKVLKAGSLDAPTVAGRFAAEGPILASIFHNNVVRFHGAGNDDERVWLELELVVGVSLREKLRCAGGLLPEEDVVRWIIDACEGVAAAHTAGVIHRDLKPTNILITDRSGVKVIDFGVAKIVKGGSGILTTVDQKLGAAIYMAPERASAAGGFDERADIYSMGATLYETLTGVHPVQPPARSVFEVVQWHLHNEPAPIRDVVPTIPSDLVAVVHKAMAKNPKDRHASMRALADELREVLYAMTAPLRREARNVVPSTQPAHAPTERMAVVDAPMSAPPASAAAKPAEAPVDPLGTSMVSGPRSALRGTLIMGESLAATSLAASRGAIASPPSTPVALPAGHAEGRVALLPVATVQMTAVVMPSSATDPVASAPSATEASRSAFAEAPASSAPLPPDRRSSGAPVSRSVEPARPRARRALLAGATLLLLLGGAASASWYGLSRGGGVGVAAVRPPPASPPTAVTSASAATHPPAPASAAKHPSPAGARDLPKRR
jgi:serine/threonine-protein kinase